MLANPKYTGHMVYGRHRTRNGRRTPAPQDQWLWSPAPVHPTIVDRALAPRPAARTHRAPHAHNMRDQRHLRQATAKCKSTAVINRQVRDPTVKCSLRDRQRM